MTLLIRCVDEAQKIPRDVVWELSCDGEACPGRRGLFPPDPETFRHYAEAMAAGWKETFLGDGGRKFLGPLLLGEDGEGAMMHGVHIQPERRDAMALRALEIRERSHSRAEALRLIEAECDVSGPTARNLIGRGEWLRAAEASAGASATSARSRVLPRSVPACASREHPTCDGSAVEASASIGRPNGGQE